MPSEKLKRIAVIGPFYPFKGGISHYSGMLARELSKRYVTLCFSFSMQYPKLLFKKEQRDYANKSFAIEDTRFIINTANPFNWGRAAAAIKKEKPDLCILSWWHPYFAPCFQGLLKKLKGIPVCFICHNVLPHERFPMDAALTKGTLKRAAFCVVHSKEDGADLKRLLPKMSFAENMHPSYNAFRFSGMSKAEAREKLELSPDEKVLLFFGLVRKYKGLEYLIKAAGALKGRIDGLKIVAAGDFGGKRAEYDALIKESGAEDCFSVRDGYVPDTDVEQYFAAADLCICPYISATQSGIVQIAFGFGLPVIATAVGGLPEAVTDGRTGFIVPPGDEGALALAIERFFKEDRAGEFAENIAAEEERFSWGHMVDTIEELYAESGSSDTRI